MVDEYWATESDLGTLGRTIKAKRDDYAGSTQATRRQELWRRAACLYWGVDPDGSFRNSQAINFGGEAGERVDIRGNIFRAFVRQIIVMATGSRPSFSCRAVAYDASTTEAVTLGNAWCDKVLDGGVEMSLRDAATYAALFGEGWIATLWDEAAGRLVGYTEDGREVRSGDLLMQSYRPDQVVRDVDCVDSQHDWVIILRLHSRWDLVARFPQHREAILAETEAIAVPLFATPGSGLGTAVNARTGNGRVGLTDRVIVQEMYHRPTATLPAGRQTWTVGTTVISDGPNPYKRLPIRCMRTSIEPTGAFGYGESWDLMALQQAFDSVLTQIVTTRENFGLANVFIQQTDDLDPEVVSSGMRIIRSNSAPTLVDLTGDAVEKGNNALTLIRGIMQQLTGLNDATLGDTGSSASGTALATMHQLAAQFNSSNQAAYATLFEGTMTDALRCLQQFCTDEQMIHVAGKNRVGMVKRFKAESLECLDGIKVELGSAAMRTTAARQEAANQLLAAGVLTTPDSYISMMATGRVEPATEGPRAAEALCERENEMLLNGQPVAALVTDDHAAHIRHHKAAADDPIVREDDGRVGNLLAHIQEHAALWMEASQNPVGVTMLVATGQQPSPALQFMQAQQPAPPPPDAPNASGAPTQNPDVSTNPGVSPLAAVESGGPVTAAPAKLPPNLNTPQA
jgi:hypothetical protein